MFRLLFNIKLSVFAVFLVLNGCGTSSQNTANSAAPTTEETTTKEEAAKHNAPDQARLDSLKAVKTKKKKEGG